jgi:hypothetical protein
MTRAKELVAGTFSAIGSVLSGPLEGCLLEAAEAAVEGPGKLTSGTWPYDAPAKVQNGAERLLNGGSRPGAASSGDLSQATLSWRQMIPTLKKEFDTHLKSALEVPSSPRANHKTHTHTHARTCCYSNDVYADL